MIHPTAIIEDNVIIGEHSSVWDHVHIRKNTSIGHHTSIGGKSIIAYNVSIGNYVKINSMVYICTAVTIEDMCMISAGTIFTNDRFPRAMNCDLTALETAEPTEETLSTLVKKGVTIGAHATIGPGIILNEFSMVGMGSIVTKEVPTHGLVIGNPARLVGYVCICGPLLFHLKESPQKNSRIQCKKCDRAYHWNGDIISLAE